MVQDATGVIVENNRVWGSKLGVNIVEVISRGPARAIVRNNYFYGSSKSPLTIDGGAQVDAYNNIFDGGADKGTSDSAHILIASGQVDTVRIYHNISYNSGKYSLALSSTSALATLYHYNNIYHTCADKYLEIQSTTPPLYSDNNIYYNSSSATPFRRGSSGTTYATLTAFSAATGNDVDSYSTDPQFRSASTDDFNLLKGSVAIDKGNGSYSTSTDYYGKRRHGPCDIGISEYKTYTSQ